MADGRLTEIVGQWLIKADHAITIVERNIKNIEPVTDVVPGIFFPSPITT